MRIKAKARSRLVVLLAFLAVGVQPGCRKDDPQAPARDDSAETQAHPREPRRSAALLLAQARFGERSVPKPACVVVLYPDAGQWTPEEFTDADSNVFHKAMPFNVPGKQPGILTIGANQAPAPATLKVWRRVAGQWQGTLIWEARFEGTHNRFRDVEVADVTGDGKAEIVVATHDKGVVAVLRQKGEAWEPQIIDRVPPDAIDTKVFVHEVEVGDVDGDGRNEIFATPSAPNTVDGSPQPGMVVMYTYDGTGFTRQLIERFENRHVKEILVADLFDAGRPDLYLALEVPLGRQLAGGPGDSQVEILRYRFPVEASTGPVEARPLRTRVGQIPDKQCRFLNAGDVDHDGRPELVASAFRSGVWVFRPSEEAWEVRCIDRNSSGYEHATALADLDGDERLEIYIAADRQRKVRRYVWNGTNFDRTELYDLPQSSMTFGLMPCSDPKFLSAGEGSE
jgi:hypothetical protein